MNKIIINKPPIVEITKDIIDVSDEFLPSDLGKWGVVLENKITLLNSKEEAVQIQEHLTDVKV